MGSKAGHIYQPLTTMANCTTALTELKNPLYWQDSTANCSTALTAVVTEAYYSRKGDDALPLGCRIKLICALPDGHDGPHLFSNALKGD